MIIQSAAVKYQHCEIDQKNKLELFFPTDFVLNNLIK